MVPVQEIVDDDSDENFDAMSLDEEEEDDVIAVGDDSDDEHDEPKPKPAKRAKTSAAAAAAPTRGKGSKATPAKARGKKADRPAMVIEKGTQDTAEKKRKLPGSMVRNELQQVGTRAVLYACAVLQAGVKPWLAASDC